MLISLFDNARDNCPKGVDVSWGEFCELCEHPDVPGTGDKRDLRAWSAARYPAGGKRSKRQVIELSALVLDYDDGTTLDEINHRWRGYRRVIHTSWSHTDEHHKARVVLPFAEPVPAAEWPRVWRWVSRRDRNIDQQCSDPSRIFFAPAIRDEWAPYVCMHEDGDPLHIPDEPKRPPQDGAKVQTVVDPWARINRRVESARLKYGHYEKRVALRRLQETLKIDPQARMKAGAELGGTMHADRVEDVPCPECGRKSVYWYGSPQGTPKALCQHRNSCGYTGWIDELLRAETRT